MTKIAYLTVDDSPSPDFMNKLDFLDSHGIKAIWFSQGNYMEQHPEWIIEAIRRGHVIANHSYSHPRFSDLSLDQCYAEIRSTDAVLKELYAQSGVEWVHRYFRFPYGDKGDHRQGDPTAEYTPEGRARHDALQAYLRKLGYTQPAFPAVTYEYYRHAGLLDHVDMYWTYDSYDWVVAVENPPAEIATVEDVLARQDRDDPDNRCGLNSGNSAEIVLVHDHDVPERIFFKEVSRMLEKGLEFKSAWNAG